MVFDRKYTPDHILKQLYKSLLTTRLVEEKMLDLSQQAKVRKWLSQTGQEALLVGATIAMRNDEWILPLHKSLGVFTSRNLPLSKLVMQWQANKEGYSNGRASSFHFASREHFIFGTISNSAAHLSVANGVALAYKLRKQNKVSLAFISDLATSEGDFHEALNMAAVWDLPIIFLIESNRYGLSGSVSEHYRWDSIVDKAKGYGIEGVRIDGNNVLEVYDTIRGVREYCQRTQRPYLIESITFRMRGDGENSPKSQEFVQEWFEKDPLRNYEEYLLGLNIIPPEDIERLRAEVEEYIEEEIKWAFNTSPGVTNTTKELSAVYRSRTSSGNSVVASSATEYNTSLINGIHEGLHECLKLNPNLILIQQMITGDNETFKITDFSNEFGQERIRKAPLCGNAIVGIGLGLSLEGYKTVIEMQPEIIVSGAFSQTVNNLAKANYYLGQNADVVIRMPVGEAIATGGLNAQCSEAWFLHTPGLKVVYPWNPIDAKGLLVAAINDPNPVIFFEHKALYEVVGDVPEDLFEVEIGKAKVVQEGDDISIITYGQGVRWATDYAKDNAGISLNILDLRTLLPLDYNAIRDSVARTGKVLILHEDTLTGGVGSEISAWIAENCFGLLDAPVMRCASLDTPVPSNRELQEQFLAVSRLDYFIKSLLTY